MNSVVEKMVGELNALVNDLGRDGGLISASVYDTAQSLRFYPPVEGVEPALEWLLEQQKCDGGWGNSAISHVRYIPTLAAILALSMYTALLPKAPSAIKAGLEFLNSQGTEEFNVSREDLPVGAELILPRMVKDASTSKLANNLDLFKPLCLLGERKLSQIYKLQPKAATPPVFSWEAWGTKPSIQYQDLTGSIGHSPTATAYWLYLAKQTKHVPNENIRIAESYLKKAEKATGLNIPGVLPTAWPITRFEQSYGLEILTLSNLLAHPYLSDSIELQIDSLLFAMQSTGLGFSDYFVPDVDDTAAAINVLSQFGQAHTHKTSLEQFENGDHYSTYPGELQFSISATARGIHAKHALGEDASSIQDALMRQQNPDGQWTGDKWNLSWLYTTFLAISALKSSSKYSGTLQRAVAAIQSQQNDDGGWGFNGSSSVTDTFYGTMALYSSREYVDVSQDSLHQAYKWLLSNYSSSVRHDAHRWLNKQEYSPYRVDKCYELSALLVLAMDEEIVKCQSILA